LVKLADRGIDVVPPIGRQVGPGQAGIIVQHHRCGLGQIGQYRLHTAGAEPVVAGHNHQLGTQRRQAARVQYGRAHQGQRCNAFRIFGDEILHIGQTTAGKMRPGDAEVVQKLCEARLDRRIVDGYGGGCYGRSPYSGDRKNNAPRGIRDRSCLISPKMLLASDARSRSLIRQPEDAEPLCHRQ
jgi:hypothetical protein